MTWSMAISIHRFHVNGGSAGPLQQSDFIENPIDGHEYDDVIESRKLFLRKMVKLGFLHFTNAPTEDAVKALLDDIDSPTNERRSKTVVFFHDESTFTATEDQPTQWGMKGEKRMKKKSKGAGIMVSDFIDEVEGHMYSQPFFCGERACAL